MFANRGVNDFKYLLELIFNFLGNEFYQLPNQKLTIVICFYEVNHNSRIGTLLADPIQFIYDVNNPLSVNELFNAIAFFDLAFKKTDNKHVSVTIEIVTPVEVN
jgi:hypothetical protein